MHQWISIKTMKKKYPRYQDYVIKNGKFIGEFEQMYQDYEDPWEQSTREAWASEKAIALNLIQSLEVTKVLELGCGLGNFTHQISRLGVKVLGMDISSTAIDKARTNFPNCHFIQSDILEFENYRRFNPDLIIMAEISWYVLDKLEKFKNFMRTEFNDKYLIHLLTVYPPNVQQYGNNYFTNLDEILMYFDATYIEAGEITPANLNGCKRTYFLGKYN